jgi:hypothetical protein
LNKNPTRKEENKMLALNEKILFFALITMNILIPAACSLFFLLVLIPIYKFLMSRVLFKKHQWEAWTLFLMVLIAAAGYLKFGPLVALIAFFGIGIVSSALYFIFVEIIFYLVKRQIKCHYI